MKKVGEVKEIKYEEGGKQSGERLGARQGFGKKKRAGWLRCPLEKIWTFRLLGIQGFLHLRELQFSLCERFDNESFGVFRR